MSDTPDPPKGRGLPCGAIVGLVAVGVLSVGGLWAFRDAPPLAFEAPDPGTVDLERTLQALAAAPAPEEALTRDAGDAEGWRAVLARPEVEAGLARILETDPRAWTLPPEGWDEAGEEPAWARHRLLMSAAALASREDDVARACELFARALRIAVMRSGEARAPFDSNLVTEPAFQLLELAMAGHAEVALAASRRAYPSEDELRGWSRREVLRGLARLDRLIERARAGEDMSLLGPSPGDLPGYLPAFHLHPERSRRRFVATLLARIESAAPWPTDPPPIFNPEPIWSDRFRRNAYGESLADAQALWTVRAIRGQLGGLSLARKFQLIAAREAYFKRHGRVPEDDAALVPEMFDALPCEPLTGAPLEP